MVENLSVFLLCGFTAIFVMPDIVSVLAVDLPRAISRKTNRRKAVLGALTRAAIWFSILLVFYIVIELMSPEAASEVLLSDTAKVCWASSVFVVFRKLRRALYAWESRRAGGKPGKATGA